MLSWFRTKRPQVQQPPPEQPQPVQESPQKQESPQTQIVSKVNHIFKDFVVNDNTDYDSYGTVSISILPKVTGISQNCLRFELKGFDEYNILYITNISNCNGTTGNMFLNLLDDLVNILSFVKKIRIQSDASQIRMCDIQIPLANLHILTSENGESWYNKHGYVNATTERDKTLNIAFGSTPVTKVFGCLEYNQPLNGIYPNVTRQDNESIPEIKTQIEKYLTLTISVRECVNHFSKLVRGFDKTKCSPDYANQVEFLRKLVNLFSKFVQYNYTDLDKTKNTESIGKGGNKCKHKSKRKHKIHNKISRRQTYRNRPSSKVRNTKSARFRQMKKNENSLRRRKYLV
jgi:hypothetical protein